MSVTIGPFVFSLFLRRAFLGSAYHSESFIQHNEFDHAYVSYCCPCWHAVFGALPPWILLNGAEFYLGKNPTYFSYQAQLDLPCLKCHCKIFLIFLVDTYSHRL